MLLAHLMQCTYMHCIKWVSVQTKPQQQASQIRACQVLQDLGVPAGAEDGHLLHKGSCSALILLALQHLAQQC